MSSNDALVEQVVAAVMREMAASTDVRAEGESDEIKITEFTEAVITEDTLRDRVNGAPRIVISAKAVVTPSGHDFLRTNKIEYQRRVAGTNPKGANTSSSWKLIISRSTDAVVRAATDVVSDSQTHWSKELVSDCREAAELGVSVICRGESKAVVIFAAEPSGVACWTNRNKKVRAAVANTASDVTRAKREVGANLIAVNPDEKSFFELRNLLKIFASGGVAHAPKYWS